MLCYADYSLVVIKLAMLCKSSGTFLSSMDDNYFDHYNDDLMGRYTSAVQFRTAADPIGRHN